MSRTAVVMWTGGFDSTLLVALLTGYNIEPDFKLDKMSVRSGWKVGGGYVTFPGFAGYDRIEVITVNSDQFSSDQAHRQFMARAAALAEIEKKTGKRISVNQAKISSDSRGIQLGKGGGICQQQIMTFMGSILMNDSSDLFLGWHYGDEAIQFIDDLYRIFDGSCTMAGKYDTAMYVPLMNMQKWSVIDLMVDIDLARLCTTCEDNSSYFDNGGITYGKFCGRCTPCKNLLSTILLNGNARDRVGKMLELFNEEAITALLSNALGERCESVLALCIKNKQPTAISEDVIKDDAEHPDTQMDKEAIGVPAPKIDYSTFKKMVVRENEDVPDIL